MILNYLNIKSLIFNMDFIPLLLVCGSILFFGLMIHRCSNDCNDLNNTSFIEDESDDYNNENEVYSKLPMSQVIER